MSFFLSGTSLDTDKTQNIQSLQIPAFNIKMSIPSQTSIASTSLSTIISQEYPPWGVKSYPGGQFCYPGVRVCVHLHSIHQEGDTLLLEVIQVFLCDGWYGYHPTVIILRGQCLLDHLSLRVIRFIKKRVLDKCTSGETRFMDFPTSDGHLGKKIILFHILVNSLQSILWLFSGFIKDQVVKLREHLQCKNIKVYLVWD